MPGYLFMKVLNELQVVKEIKAIGAGGVAGILKDSSNVKSADFGARQLFDDTGVLSADYRSRALYDAAGVNPTVIWRLGKLYDASLVISANWMSRILVDTNGTPVVNWDTRILDGGSWSLNTSKITDVGDATLSADAVNLAQATALAMIFG